MTDINPVVKGSLVALVTPMSANGSIDFETLHQLVEWHIQQKTDGIVIMGTTGESSLVSEQELLEVVSTVISIVKGRILVIAGCGGTSTSKTIELAQRLAPLKPDALLCVTPYYVKPEQEGLIAHYNAVANSTPIGVILYNVPSRTGCDLSNESVLELSANKNIIGLKDATAELDRVVQLRKVLPDNFALLSGDDESALEYMVSGGNGVISVTANISPSKMFRWISFAESGDMASAKCEFSLLMPLHKMLFIESNPIPVKWALHLMGKVACGYRLPLAEPSKTSKTLIKRILKENDLV